MTNSQTLFENTGSSQAEAAKVDQPEAVEAKPQASTFENLVGEGKKYSDTEALAKAKLEADNHIKRIEEENAREREEKAELKKKLESLDNNYSAILAKLEEKKSVSTQDKQDAPQDSNENQGYDIENLIETTLTKREQRLIEEANIQRARKLADETYGNAEVANKVFEELIAQKPYMTDALRNLLRTSPETLIQELKAFKSPEEVGSNAGDPVGTVNNNVVDTNGRYVTWSQARKVMKSDIKRYASQEYKKLIKDSEAYWKSKGQDFYKL